MVEDDNIYVLGTCTPPPFLDITSIQRLCLVIDTETLFSLPPALLLNRISLLTDFARRFCSLRSLTICWEGDGGVPRDAVHFSRQLESGWLDYPVSSSSGDVLLEFFNIVKREMGPQAFIEGGEGYGTEKMGYPISGNNYC